MHKVKIAKGGNPFWFSVELPRILITMLAAGVLSPRWEVIMKARYIVALSMLAGVAVGALAIQGLHAQAKPPVYFVVENDISDAPSYLKEYAAHARVMIKANGGRYLAAGEATTFVGEPPKSRVAIFVFDDLQQIQTFLNSPDYKELRKVGEKYAKFRNYAVPGVPQ
jgi:uncharacterized protein (DUF1330 family)